MLLPLLITNLAVSKRFHELHTGTNGWICRSGQISRCNRFVCPYIIVEQKSAFINCGMAHDHKITHLMRQEIAFIVALFSRC